MEPSNADPSLYFKFDGNILIGMNGTYVDDLLRCGLPEFESMVQKTYERFETTGTEELPFTFAGINIRLQPDDSFALDQLFYHQKLETLQTTATFSEFRSMRMKLAWLAHTRPDLCVDISQLAQITESVYNDGPKSAVKRLNKSIKFANDNLTHMKFPKLDLSTIRIVGYSDAAFASNSDLSSQLGRIVLLIDGSGAAAIVSFKSYKSRRVTRSVLSAEVIAFADLFDDAFTIRKQLEHALQRSVHMHLLTDSKCLFDIIGKGSRTNEKRLMLDISVTRQAYNADQISNIGFVRSNYNLADGLTKPKLQQSLHDLLRTGRHEVVAEQWIIRNPP